MIMMTDTDLNVLCVYQFLPRTQKCVLLKNLTLKLKVLDIQEGRAVAHCTLRYKPAGRGFDSRWCHWNFSVT
jgi:hypothetical protein